MWDNFKYTLLSIVRNPALLFWPLGFPIILSTLFSFMFANLDECFQLQPVALGVVQDETYESAFGLDDTLRSFDGSAADSEQHFFDLTYYAAEDEAEAMYDYMTAHGVDPSRILIEDKATSTEENLSYSFDIIRARGQEPAGRVAIVSSAYHLYRAKLFANKLGVPDAAGVAAPWGYFFVMLNYFIREAFGVTHFWLLGD